MLRDSLNEKSNYGMHCHTLHRQFKYEEGNKTVSIFSEISFKRLTDLEISQRLIVVLRDSEAPKLLYASLKASEGRYKNRLKHAVHKTLLKIIYHKTFQSSAQPR